MFGPALVDFMYLFRTSITNVSYFNTFFAFGFLLGSIGELNLSKDIFKLIWYYSSWFHSKVPERTHCFHCFDFEWNDSIFPHSSGVWALVCLWFDVYYWFWNRILPVRGSCLDHINVEDQVILNNTFNTCYVQYGSLASSFNQCTICFGRCDQNWPTNGGSQHNTQGSDKLLNQ